jgi:hypothetical protein
MGPQLFDALSQGGTRPVNGSFSQLPAGPGFGRYGPQDTFRPQQRQQTAGGGNNYSVGGWYNGRQWNGSQLGNPGQQTVGGGNQSNQGNQGNQGSQGNPQQPDMSMFDAIINPVIDNFNRLMSTQQQTSANTQAGLNTQRKTQLDTQNAQFAGQEQGLQRAGEQQTQSSQNAMEEARRMYAEMSQGNQARYGATTGTGQFMSEQLGQQTSRNIAQLQQGLQQHMQDINDKRLQVKQMGELATRSTNERFDQAIQTEKDNLQKYVTQIQGNQAMLQSNKAQMYMQAVQKYQDTLTNIEAQRQQQQHQLQIAQLNADAQLKIHQQTGQRALQDVASNTPNYSAVGTNNLDLYKAVGSGGLNVLDTGQNNRGQLSIGPQANAFQSASGMRNKLGNTP